jgi:hypothetical protein
MMGKRSLRVFDVLAYAIVLAVILILMVKTPVVAAEPKGPELSQVFIILYDDMGHTGYGTVWVMYGKTFAYCVAHYPSLPKITCYRYNPDLPTAEEGVRRTDAIETFAVTVRDGV